MEANTKVLNTFNTETEIKIGKNVTYDTYQRMPVSDYGRKMLESMGWYEGRGVGLNPDNSLCEPIQYIPRHHLLGLGATPKQLAGLSHGKGKHGHNSNSAIPDFNYQASKFGSTNFKGISEKLKKKKQIEGGSAVYIFRGRHKGLFGTIKQVISPDSTPISLTQENTDPLERSMMVELCMNGQTVKIQQKKMILAEEKEKFFPDESKKKNKNHKKSKKRKHRDHEKEVDTERLKIRHKKRSTQLEWVHPNIKVRVISKKAEDGKLYNLKVKVQDVLDLYNFTVMTDKGVLYENLREKHIETIIPSVAEDVMVLKGKERGQIGKIIDKDKRNQLITVQLYNDTLDISTFDFDDCCALWKA